MFNIFFLFSFIILSSCSHINSSPEVKNFVQTWDRQYQNHDPDYSKTYEKYLVSVEDVYKDHHEEEKFKTYLESLKNNSQILADQLSALPQLYKNETGRSIASSYDETYHTYKTSKMTALYDKLFIARELKIQDEAGESLYNDLQANYDKFMIEQRATKYGFPL